MMSPWRRNDLFTCMSQLKAVSWFIARIYDVSKILLSQFYVNSCCRGYRCITKKRLLSPSNLTKSEMSSPFSERTYYNIRASLDKLSVNSKPVRSDPLVPMNSGNLAPQKEEPTGLVTLETKARGGTRLTPHDDQTSDWLYEEFHHIENKKISRLSFPTAQSVPSWTGRLFVNESQINKNVRKVNVS